MHTASAHDFWSMRPIEDTLDPATPHLPPLGVHSLRVLADLGLSDAQIARYFKVSESRVQSLRRYYGLA